MGVKQKKYRSAEKVELTDRNTLQVFAVASGTQRDSYGLREFRGSGSIPGSPGRYGRTDHGVGGRKDAGEIYGVWDSQESQEGS